MRRSHFFQILIAIMLAIALTSCGTGSQKKTDPEKKDPEKKDPEQKDPEKKHIEWKRLWINVDCDDANSSSDFYVWTEKTDTELIDLGVGLCNALPRDCPPSTEWSLYTDPTIEITVRMSSITDIPSDGGVEIAVTGRANHKFTIDTVLGEFTKESTNDDYDIQWKPSEGALSDLDLVLKFGQPINTQSNKMIMHVYYEDVLVGGADLFKDLVSADINSCPTKGNN